MKKRIIAISIVAMGLSAIAGPALADQTIDVPGVGTVTQTGDATGGSVVAEGNDSNPGPASGFVSAEGTAGPPPAGAVCADDNGNTETSASPTCTSDYLP